MVYRFELRIEGLGFRGLRVLGWGFGFVVWGRGLGVWGLVLKVWY
jgi:hypothetical protein